MINMIFKCQIKVICHCGHLGVKAQYILKCPPALSIVVFSPFSHSNQTRGSSHPASLHLLPSFSFFPLPPWHSVISQAFCCLVFNYTKSFLSGRPVLHHRVGGDHNVIIHVTSRRKVEVIESAADTRLLCRGQRVMCRSVVNLYQHVYP